ncbi:MAG: ABC transporter permease [Vicinamibacteria bacterium]
MRARVLVSRSLRHYAGTNAAVVAGVAVAASVLIGALVVGDSLRATLRGLALARIGRTGHALTAARSLDETLAQALASRTGRPTAPLVATAGAVAHEASGRRATNVKIYGVDERFWTFHGVPVPPLGDRQAALSTALADELAAADGETLLLRLELPSDVPAASLFGRKDDRARTLRVTRGPVLAADAMGEFSLDASQQAVRAVFVPLRALQRTLAQPGRVNTVLLGAGTGAPDEAVRAELTLDQLGVRVRPVTAQAALSVESTSGFVSSEVERAATEAAAATGLSAAPVLTYLANELRVGDRAVPYSLLAGLAPEPLRALAGTAAAPERLVLGDWAARELGARVGDPVKLTYFVWLEEGRLETRDATMTVEAIVPLAGAADDRDLSPEYPGITDSAHLADWDPPFPVDLARVRPQDERYWEEHRTTPKAFLPLAAAQALWKHRLGAATSVRVTAGGGAPLAEARPAFERALRDRLDPAAAGVAVVPVRAQALAAAQGAGDFGEYFLAFSAFLLVAALLLAGLFFRLGVEQRAREVGLLRALGWTAAGVRRLLMAEGLALAAAGAVLGVAGAVAFAWLVLLGLRTVWVDAVGLRTLRLALSPGAIAAGAASAVAAAAVSIRLALRALRHASPRALLAGGAATPAPRAPRWPVWAAAAGFLLAAALVAASVRGAVPAAGGFFGAGFGLLGGGLALVWHRLTRPRSTPPASAGGLGLRNASWRPGRSVLVVALIAFGTFVVVAVGAFRKGALQPTGDRSAGDGGYALVGESSLPLLHDPGSQDGREALDLPPQSLDGVAFTRLRLLPGDEASCLNLYRPQRPRVLGVPASFVREGRFAFAASLAATDAERANPWLLLDRRPEDGTVPAIADANSLQYVLHGKLGEVMEIERGTGAPLRLRFVATLRDSLFQGEILVAERPFLAAFPDDPGYRFFLLDAPPARAAAIAGALESSLERLGLDLTSAPERIDRFHRVENAYLSTFQTLGALGLLLGTAGLAAVLLRNALERRRELALLRAVGYGRPALTRLVLAEHGLLLAAGLGIGVVAALVAIAPAALERGARLPVVPIAVLALAIAGVGLAASLVAARLLHRAPLLSALKDE